MRADRSLHWWSWMAGVPIAVTSPRLCDPGHHREERCPDSHADDDMFPSTATPASRPTARIRTPTSAQSVVRCVRVIFPLLPRSRATLGHVPMWRVLGPGAPGRGVVVRRQASRNDECRAGVEDGPVYTRPANTTRPAMAARVRAAASSGSHHAAAPSAMRPGMANGAVAGKSERSWDHPLSGSAADGEERGPVAGDQHVADGPGDALRVLGPRGQRAERPVGHGVEGVAEHEPHRRPRRARRR